MWDEAARAPARERPALTATMGLLRATRRAMREKSPRAAEALEVEQDHVGPRILGPVLHEVVRRDVGLVPDRHERRDAEVQARRVVEQREAERPALRRQRHAALGRIGRSEGGVQAHGRVRVHEAHAVGSDHPHAGVADLLEQCRFQAPALFAGLTEAGRDDDDAFDALGDAVVDGPGHRSRRHGNHGEIDGAVDVGEAGVAANALDFGGRRIHGQDRAAKAGRDEVVEDLRADLAALAAGADDRDRTRLEEAGHRGRGGLLGAVRGLFLEVGRQRQRDLDAFAFGSRLAPHRESAAREDVEHARVRRRRPGLEDPDAARAGDLGEALEQPRADALAAKGLLDGERHLRARRIGGVAPVVRHRDDPSCPFAHVSIAIAVVDVARGRRGLRVRAVDAEEAEVHAVGGQAPLEVGERAGVLAPDRAQPQGRARAQDDVRRLVRGIVGRRGRVGHRSGNDARFRPSTRAVAASSARCLRAAASQGRARACPSRSS